MSNGKINPIAPDAKIYGQVQLKKSGQDTALPDISDSFSKNNDSDDNLVDIKKASQDLFNPGEIPLQDFKPMISPYRTCSPAVSSEGTIFISDNKKKFQAIDGKTGEILWKKRFKAGDQSSVLSPDEKNVYVADNDGRVHALNSKNGKKVWEYKPAFFCHPTTPVTSKDGKTLIVGDYKTIASVDASTGKPDWVVDSEEALGNSVTMDSDFSTVLTPDENTIYAATSKDVKIWSIDAKTGKTNWFKETGWLWASNLASLASGKKGVVYAANGLGEITALDRKRGEKKWSVNIPDYDVCRGDVNLIPDHDGERLYAVMPRVMDMSGDYAKVYALDPENGDVQWEFKYRCKGWSDHDRPRSATLSKDGETLLVGDDFGKLHAIDTRTGKNDWTYFGNRDFFTYGQKYNGDESQVYITQVRYDGEGFAGLKEKEDHESQIIAINAKTGMKISDFAVGGKDKEKPADESDLPRIEKKEKSVVIGGVELPVRAQD
ncbi:MAG: PQQ-like beta-propeller repeat protein [Candidatus Eremiobacteraeota bacterium]|nr:PQQ-like beta-propeller repeat protein [Candidatus Eremiobacteraeota bacterium]